MEAGNDGNPIGISFSKGPPFSGSMFVFFFWGGCICFFFQSHHFEPLYDIEILGLYLVCVVGGWEIPFI